MKGRKTQIADKQIEKNTSLAEKGDNEVTEGESKKAVPDPIHEEFKKALKQSDELNEKITSMIKCDKIICILLFVIILLVVIGRYIFNEMSYAKFQ